MNTYTFEVYNCDDLEKFLTLLEECGAQLKSIRHMACEYIITYTHTEELGMEVRC